MERIVLTISAELYLSTAIKVISLSLQASHYQAAGIWTPEKMSTFQNMSQAVKFTQTGNVDNSSVFILR